MLVFCKHQQFRLPTRNQLQDCEYVKPDNKARKRLMADISSQKELASRTVIVVFEELRIDL
jgi:hypothetical protein